MILSAIILKMQFPIENQWSNLKFHAKNSPSKCCATAESVFRSSDHNTEKKKIHVDHLTSEFWQFRNRAGEETNIIFRQIERRSLTFFIYF